MFVDNVSLSTCCQRYDAFKHAFSSSAGLLLGMTGSVCLKSPAMTTDTPLNRVLLYTLGYRHVKGSVVA